MAHYIDADKLIAEIERRMDKHWDLLPNADSPEDDWTHNELCELGAFKELEHLETFLDSLQQEQPEVDLEKEIKDYWEKICDDEFGELIPRVRETAWFDDIARHFAEWGAEHARKEDK